MGRKSIAWRILALCAILSLVAAAVRGGATTDTTDGLGFHRRWRAAVTFPTPMCSSPL